MAMIPFSKFHENPLTFQKFKKNPNNQNIKKTRPNLNSIWGFMSCIFIYMCVFYTFNFSLPTLICTTKFWFFISNTLILILAADFAAFSSSKRRRNFYNEHVIIDTYATSPKDCAFVPFETTASLDDVYEEVKPRENNTIIVMDDFHQRKRQKCERSNSESAVVVAAADEGEVVALHRTSSEIHDREEDENVDEFSRMSNEELNKRVEDFIRKFNTQIRLQALRNRQNLECMDII